MPFSFMAMRFYIQKKHDVAPVILYAWRIPSGLIFLAEDPQHPKLQAYRRHEHLDQVVAPYTTDFQKILALAQWTSRQFSAGSPFPNYPPWDASIILDRIRHGKTGGFCAQYAFVFGQACQSFGYQPRYLDISSPENNGGHFTTEIYVPSLSRWIIFEPEWGIYYIDGQGHPLDALELHQYAVKEKQGKVIRMPTREIVTSDWLRLFYFFRYYLRNNYLSVPVFFKKLPNKIIEFSPYRLAWLDSFTDVDINKASAYVSSSPAAFHSPLQFSKDPMVVCQNISDFYMAISKQPANSILKISMPYRVLVNLVKKDLIHDPTYHRLKA
jgi:hypothetical protein